MNCIDALSANQTYNITTNGITVIPVPKTPQGANSKWILVRIIVNTKGASSNTATIYDSNETIGANAEFKKGTLDTVNTLGSVEYGFPMYNGIYIVTATGTAPDLTIVYKETP